MKGVGFRLECPLRPVFQIASTVSVVIMIGSLFAVCHRSRSYPVIVGQFVDYYCYHDIRMLKMFVTQNPMTDRQLRLVVVLVFLIDPMRGP